MSVIVELSLTADEFRLGRILQVEDDTGIALETMVPLGEGAVPFFRTLSGTRDRFEETVRTHPAVDEVQEVETLDGEALYALDWERSEDTLFAGLESADVHLLRAMGRARTWVFEVRFETYEALSAFREHCVEADVRPDIERMYDPTSPDSGPWYGLTDRQRETLVRAVAAGYYAIPRQVTTEELAEEFGISDQSVTERLRRATRTLVENTLHAERVD